MPEDYPNLKVLGGYIHRRLPPWKWDSFDPPLNWDGFLFHTLLAGRMQGLLQDKSLDINPGDTVLIPIRSQRLVLESVGEDPLVIAWFHFTCEEVGDAVPLGFKHVVDLAFWEHMLYRTLDALYRKDDNGAAVRTWLRAVLRELREQGRPARPMNQAAEDRSWRIGQLRRQIRMNPGGNWSLKAMARAVQVSPGHFLHLFRREQGCNPGEFVIQARIELAKDYLLMSRRPIKEIAHLLGYCDPFAFSNQFKARTGQSPSQFRLAGASSPNTGCLQPNQEKADRFI